MEEKDMTFEEFEQQVRVELARYLHQDVDSAIINDRMSEKSSKDIILDSWKTYNREKIFDWSRRRIQMKGADVAANCISML